MNTRIRSKFVATAGLTAILTLGITSPALASVTDGNGNYINGGQCRQLVDPHDRSDLNDNKSLIINVIGQGGTLDVHTPQGSGAGCGTFPG